MSVAVRGTVGVATAEDILLARKQKPKTTYATTVLPDDDERLVQFLAYVAAEKLCKSNRVRS